MLRSKRQNRTPQRRHFPTCRATLSAKRREGKILPRCARANAKRLAQRLHRRTLGGRLHPTDEPPPHRLEYEQRKRGNHKIYRRRNHKDPMPMTTIVLEEAGQRHNPGCCAFRGVEQPGISCGVFRAKVSRPDLNRRVRHRLRDLAEQLPIEVCYIFAEIGRPRRCSLRSVLKFRRKRDMLSLTRKTR